VLAFLLAFSVVALATTVAASLAIRLYMENNSMFLGTESWQEWVAAHLALIALLGAGTFGVMGLASLYRAATLSRGGAQVARMVGATEVDSETTDPRKRRLVNVVEEMALAAGLPVPAIFVLEPEEGINAFAAGLHPNDAAITVTRGALEHLDRAELQGVIGHEFSHILNGDMRLNQQLIGLSFGILVLSLVGRWLLRSASYSRRGRNSGGVAAAFAMGVALVVIGAIGVLLSRLIKAGVARERERLADASAVQFTRDPSGLAGALKKIGGYSSRITSVETEEVAHMLFERGSPSFAGWFATHPPLLERIRALEPGFDPRDLPTPGDMRAAPSVSDADMGPTAGFASAASGPTAPDGAASGLAAAAPAALTLERAGEIDAPAVGGALREALPEEIYHATHSRDGSLLLAFALALSPNAAARDKQLALLTRQFGATRTGLCARLADDLDRLPANLRLPVVELAVPALKQRPAAQLAYLLDQLQRVAQLDDEPRLFDFVLLRVLEAYLRPSLRVAALRQKEPLDRASAVRALLATVAAFGHDTAAGALSAYTAGLAASGLSEDAAVSFEPLDGARRLDRLDSALGALLDLPPRGKSRLLASVRATIEADAVVATEERELFRLIAATLDCPLPPGANA